MVVAAPVQIGATVAVELLAVKVKSGLVETGKASVPPMSPLNSPDLPLSWIKEPRALVL